MCNSLGRRRFLQALCAALPLANASAVSARPAYGRRLYVQPLGRGILPDHLRRVRCAIEAFFPFDVAVLPTLPLPKEAYYPPRRRYRAERLLGVLERSSPADADRVLGITAVDISTTKGKVKDWGILGLATIDGRVCVLSKFRCARGVQSQEQALTRLAKIAVHEVGHTLGLDHCSTVGCLMEDAQGTVTTADREYDLCARCRDALARGGTPAVPDSAPPWPEVSEDHA